MHADPCGGSKPPPYTRPSVSIVGQGLGPAAVTPQAPLSEGGAATGGGGSAAITPSDLAVLGHLSRCGSVHPRLKTFGYSSPAKFAGGAHRNAFC